LPDRSGSAILRYIKRGTDAPATRPGAIMRLFLSISAFVLLGASAALACTVGDQISPDLTFEDLTPTEREGFEILFTAERTVMNSENIAVDDAFAFDRCDLAGDGSGLIMVFAKPGLFCETGCLGWAMNRTEDEDWQIILAAEGDLSIAASYSMGWPDLIAQADGMPPIVHKYDGASYRDELEGLIYGEAFDLPEAVAWEADEFGFVGIVPGSAGPNGEAVVALDAVAENLSTVIDGLLTGLTDLNDDSIPEVIIQGEGPEYCAAEGCRTWIVSVSGPDATILADVTAQGSLEIASSASGAYRDVIVWGDAGAQVLRHDGEVYR